jgi:N-formylglutamate deformylase
VPQNGYSLRMAPGDPIALWWGQEAACPVVAVAIHAGHALRDEVADLTAVPAERRFREEDAGTDEWAMCFPTRLVAGRSRFEIDLNRPRDSAVYGRREDCWDVDPWHGPLPPEVVQRSLQVYDAFYAVLAGILDRTQDMFGRFVVYDLHSYNYRRGGPTAPPGNPADRPDINVGTGSMDRDRCGPVVDRFMADLGSVKMPDADRPLDVRKNVVFRGRELARWVHTRYPETGCALAIEVKKFFMDEHTGQIDCELSDAVGDALARTVPGVIDVLGQRSP